MTTTTAIPNCDQCPDPGFVEYANGGVRCVTHVVPFVWLDVFDPD